MEEERQKKDEEEIVRAVQCLFTCDGNGNGNHPVSGTSNGTEVIPSHL